MTDDGMVVQVEDDNPESLAGEEVDIDPDDNDDDADGSEPADGA